jgi:hypothetical protein
VRRLLLLGQEGSDERDHGTQRHADERPHRLDLLVAERVAGEEVHADQQEDRDADQGQQQTAEHDPEGRDEPARHR